MPIYINGKRVNKIFNGTKEVNTVYVQGVPKFVSPLKKIPGWIYYDGRTNLSIDATYKFYNSSLQLILTSSSTLTGDELITLKNNAVYYSNESGNTTDCFSATYHNNTLWIPMGSGYYRWSNAAEINCGITASDTWDSAVTNTNLLRSHFQGSSTSKFYDSSTVAYRIFNYVNSSAKPYDFSNWLVGGVFDVKSIFGVFPEEIGTSTVKDEQQRFFDCMAQYTGDPSYLGCKSIRRDESQSQEKRKWAETWLRTNEYDSKWCTMLVARFH